MSTCFDVVVVGAGPGGIAAAVVAAEAGKRVCLLDANPSPGGQIWRGAQRETAQHYPHGSAFASWTARLAKSGCTVWSGWQAVDRPASGCLSVESESDSREVGFEQLILATGARERFLAFPGWTLPGVMGAGGAQALVKTGLEARGKRVVVAGSGPLLLAVAAGLTSAGARVEGIFEQAPVSRVTALGWHMLIAQPSKLVEGGRYRLRTLRASYSCDSWVTRAEGRGRVERVWITVGKKERALDCDWLVCGFHLVPNLELPRLLGCRIDAGYVAVDAMQQSSVTDVACVGELTGIGGLEKALVEGQIAGYAASGLEPQARSLDRQFRHQQNFAARLDRAFALRAELRRLPEDNTVVCRCEDVTHQALATCASWRQAKLHTRCGMGPCQGRICGAAAEFVYGWTSADTRPPIFPSRISTLAARRNVAS